MLCRQIFGLVKKTCFYSVNISLANYRKCTIRIWTMSFLCFWPIKYRVCASASHTCCYHMCLNITSNALIDVFIFNYGQLCSYTSLLEFLLIGSFSHKWEDKQRNIGRAKCAICVYFSLRIYPKNYMTVYALCIYLVLK